MRSCSYDVYADNALLNTAGQTLCTTTDSNGIIAINDGHMSGDDVNAQHGQFHLCPTTASPRWVTVSGNFTATSSMVTLRLHSESQDAAYFDRVSMTVLQVPPPTAGPGGPTGSGRR